LDVVFLIVGTGENLTTYYALTACRAQQRRQTEAADGRPKPALCFTIHGKGFLRHSLESKGTPVDGVIDSIVKVVIGTRCVQH